ncbi:MAG: PLxRFG domain-containing protein, partial [Caulobacteraceae bacterium]|nr:PLxRFG domain-containing protein [Caulobacteraceae bacterium]
TLHHEIIHALRSMNLFTADEWRILSEASERDWVNRIWPGDSQSVAKIYSKEPRDIKIEEGVARAFENYTLGEFQPKGAIARIFQKTKEFFKKLADYATGLGIKEDEAEVFERILSGEIGSRLRKDQTLYRVPYDKVVADQATKEEVETLERTEQIIYDVEMLNVKPEESIDNLVKSGPEFKDIKDGAKNYIKDKAADKANVILSAFNLRQLGELADKALPQIKMFYRTVNDMLAFRDTRITKAADIAKGWVAFRDKHPKIAEILADVMHGATILGLDPDKNLEEIKHPEALKIYREVRDYYAESLDLYQKALEQRIKESIEDDRQKTAALLKIEQEFNKIRSTGPYFPLARFGDYWVSFKAINDEGKQMPEYYMFENRAEQRQFEDQLRKDGVSFKSGVKSRQMLGAGVPMTGFMREMMGLVDGMDGDKEMLKDNLWQLFLTMQPDLSARKHFIHRKKVAGYSTDALRAFAETSFHGAYHLARVKYNGRLESIVLEADKHRGDNPSIEADRYFDELLLRQKWVNAPEDVNSFTSWATSFSFMYFLTAPASALVNLAQTPMIAFPYLGGKFGYTRAFSELSTASKQFFASGISKEKGFYDVIRTLKDRAEAKGISDKERQIRQEELAAMQQLYEDGTLNRTRRSDRCGVTNC